VRSGSSTIVNVSLGYPIGEHFRLALDVVNLFDRVVDDVSYSYASRLPGEPADGVEDRHFHPA
jgi:outer membrane receptor protein involved in Fe transport